MEDKFILMGLNDDRAGHVAEVLKNKTCKKILDFLAERKEASEQDIANSLKIPINTAEYNLGKLVKSGLVEKAKNFFWSVKGKKIPMYKLARKHIIISPNKNPSLDYLKSILPAVFIALAIIALLFLLSPKEITDETQMKQFVSQSQLENFLKENSENAGIFGGVERAVSGIVPGVKMSAESADASAGSGAASDYSTTNIQVEGVDEADIVKNDGKYIYVVTGNKVAILNAYPAENMEILSEIDLNKSISEIFINDNKLVVFSSGYDYIPYLKGCVAEGIRCGGYQKYSSFVYVYDISDRESPALEDELETDGSYVDSRMIGDYVYVVSTKYADAGNPEPPVFIMNDVETKVRAEDVYYWDYPDTSYTFTLIYSINVENGDFNNKVYLTGSTSTIYVSQNNIYLTCQKTVSYEDYAERMAEEVYFPLLPAEEDEKIKRELESGESSYLKLREIQKIVESYVKTLDSDEFSKFSEELEGRLEDFNRGIEKEREKTVVHKINVNKEEIKYEGVGEVPGRILNQFSMDEYNGYFRIATTTGEVWRSDSSSLNHLYILDSDLKIVGKVEDLASGERIYSVRFLGDRAYIVTFKKVDPLFVIDVSNPRNPEVLGYLKITGYSDYLHIYDENHIIGLGKETEGGNEDFSWYQGIKISLFDVSDVSHPVEEAKIEIGDRGTDSPALYEHKAFLFDKDKNLLVLPVNLAEIDTNQYKVCSAEELNSYDTYHNCLTDSTYGEQVWQGAYVLDISLDGISVRGKITHFDNESKYRPAKDEPIGAEREIYGQKYTKTGENIWEVSNGYQDMYTKTVYTDEYIDQLPGGINYHDFYNYKYQIQRSLYMDNVLYTISNAKVKANDLKTIKEISSVDLGYEEEVYPYPMYESIAI